MKRIIIAAVILIFVSAASVFILGFYTKRIDRMVKIADDLQTALDSGDLDKCLTQSHELIDEFKSSSRFFPLFMRHSDIARIEETLVALPVLIETGSTQHFAAELARCKNMLENLAELENPTLENIL